MGTNLYLSCKDIWDIWADTNTGVVEVHRITVHRGPQPSSGLDRIEQHLLKLNRLEPILQTFCFPPSPRAVGFWLVHLCLSFAIIAFFPAALPNPIHDDPIPFYADQTASLPWGEEEKLP